MVCIEKLLSLCRNSFGNGLMAALLMCGASVNARDVEAHFPVLQVGATMYTNATVTVTGKSGADLFILHSKGIATLKIKDLDDATRARLGFPSRNATQASAVPAQAVENAFSEMMLEEPSQPESSVKLGGLAGLFSVAMLLFVVIMYVPFCMSCANLCKKAGTPSAILVYLPVVKQLALFRATGVSWLYFFLGLFIPFVGLIGWIVCCQRLCETCNRSKWLVLAMVLPPFGWLAFISLARGSRKEDHEPVLRDNFALPNN